MYQIQQRSEIPHRLQAVVLGASVGSYSLARAWWEAYGTTSIMLSRADVKFATASRFVDHRLVPDLDEEQGMVAALLAIGQEMAEKQLIVLNGDDWHARFLAKHRAELEPYYILPVIEFDLLDRLQDKQNFYADCAAEDVAFPALRLFDCNDQSVTISVEEFSYPVVAKPSNTPAYFAADFPGKKKIFLIDSPEELTSVFQRLQASSYDKSLIVQDYVPGDDQCMRVLTCYGDESGEVVLAALGHVLLEDHRPTAIGDFRVIINCHDDELLAAAAKLMKRWRYHGFAHFDIKWDARDQTFRFFEVNTRLGGSNYYVTSAGENIVEWIVDDLVLGQAKSPVVIEGPHLHSAVLPLVARRSILDPESRAQVRALMKGGQWANPIWSAHDGWRQRFWALVHMINEVRLFRRYLWQTPDFQARRTAWAAQAG